ncbi:MFS transporter [Candidatus Bathyarchaeota archaeon ex4484_40]|nr:MAG: MFS transporter [Candidatus Bathyarchaeota archaeon ex4484_40]
MIWPILPMFITSIGGGGLAVGLIGGLGESVSSILKVFSGYWSDRLGRRKILVTSGYALSSVSKALFPFVGSWIHLLILRPIERVGKGLRTAPRDVSFGIHRALDTSGALLGSFLAFIFVWFLNLNFRSILLIAAAIGFFALVPLIPVREAKANGKGAAPFKIGLKELGKPFKLFIAIVTLFTLGNFSYMFFILRARDVFYAVFPERLAEAIPILLYILFNISYALFSIPLGRVSDRIGKGKVLIIGYVIFALTCIGFIFSETLQLFVALFLMYGLFHASVDAVQRAYASDLAPEEWRGTALGTFHASIGLATLPASTIAGILWDIEPKLTFAFGASLALAAACLLTLLMGRLRPERAFKSSQRRKI